jgi:hypothetical protein
MKLISFVSNKIVEFWRPLALMMFAVLLFIYSMPIRPITPNKSDLRYIYGMPKYQESNSVKHGTTIYFSVDDMYLDTGYTPLLGGDHGCEIYRYRIDLNLPVRASYFIVYTRFGFRVNLLNTIEQKGHFIVSEADTYLDRYN